MVQTTNPILPLTLTILMWCYLLVTERHFYVKKITTQYVQGGLWSTRWISLPTTSDASRQICFVPTGREVRHLTNTHAIDCQIDINHLKLLIKFLKATLGKRWRLPQKALNRASKQVLPWHFHIQVHITEEQLFYTQMRQTIRIVLYGYSIRVKMSFGLSLENLLLILL